ncbi:hypothetical protein FQN54_004190 [Arachnomyces sp. PD_36]|nr:hypothetical protein FQN54_004190 [Arachnomyces sp. PD_36]
MRYRAPAPGLPTTALAASHAPEEAKSNTPGSGTCYSCEQETDRKCSDCGKDWFCSPRCQKKRTTRHLWQCSGGRPLTSADYLIRDFVEDKLPTDPQVQIDFWFNRLPSAVDQSNLLGLFQGLLRIREEEEDGEVDNLVAETLHKWQVEGTLVENIVQAFHTWPEEHRGGYFPWFSRNRAIFERSETPEESSQNGIASVEARGRALLDPEDRNKSFAEFRPQVKVICYRFCVLVLHHVHPPPSEEEWLAFGFCVCADKLEEKKLGGVYIELLLGEQSPDSNLESTPGVIIKNKGCTFTEFWKAYESRTLFDLMASRGLGRRCSEIRNLEYFLRHGPRESVWDLAQFVANEEALVAPFPVMTDYGFESCRGFVEIMGLKDVYRELLARVDHLELHKACLEGKIFEFARRNIEVAERFRGFMRNRYPLKRYG